MMSGAAQAENTWSCHCKWWRSLRRVLLDVPLAFLPLLAPNPSDLTRLPLFWVVSLYRLTWELSLDLILSLTLLNTKHIKSFKLYRQRGGIVIHELKLTSEHMLQGLRVQEMVPCARQNTSLHDFTKFSQSFNMNKRTVNSFLFLCFYRWRNRS